MPEVELAKRLKVYGLDPTKVRPVNLDVPARKELIVRAEDPAYARQFHKLVPKRIEDVKQWMGVSNKAFKRAVPLMINVPLVISTRTKLTEKNDIVLREIARNYVFGHSEAVPKDMVAVLDKWIEYVGGFIGVIIFQDINVAAGATLVYTAATPVLFANNITIGHGGKIVMQATNSKIDCAGITGL